MLRNVEWPPLRRKAGSIPAASTNNLFYVQGLSRLIRRNHYPGIKKRVCVCHPLFMCSSIQYAIPPITNAAATTTSRPMSSFIIGSFLQIPLYHHTMHLGIPLTQRTNLFCCLPSQLPSCRYMSSATCNCFPLSAQISAFRFQAASHDLTLCPLAVHDRESFPLMILFDAGCDGIWYNSHTKSTAREEYGRGPAERSLRRLAAGFQKKQTVDEGH